MTTELLAQTQAVGLTIPKPLHHHHIAMEKIYRNSEQRNALREAARIMGSIGGKAGRGDSKRRPSEVCRAAILKRWEAYRKTKALEPKS